MLSLMRPEIEALIDLPTAVEVIAAAYRATSLGEVNLPPVGHITFPDEADCHIKYGHVKGDPNFVVKVATGFPRNSGKGLPSGNGLVLVLSAQTGAVEAVLHDEMVLTDVRTGLGGAIASRTLAHTNSKTALIIGTGTQARRQIEAHAALMPQLSFRVWGRNAGKVTALIADMARGYTVEAAATLECAANHSDIIITATGSTTPFLQSGWVQPGTHITAVGADAPGKQELDVTLVARADLLVVDSMSQCLDHAEVSRAAKFGLIMADDIQEIGTILSCTASGRTNDSQITIADLTGVAAQDIAMANAVLTAWKGSVDGVDAVGRGIHAINRAYGLDK